MWVRCLGECYPIVPTGVPIGQHWALGVVALEEILLMSLGSPPGEFVVVALYNVCLSEDEFRLDNRKLRDRH